MTPVAANEDADLVSASLAGNREAFGHIVARYQSLVCSLAYSATGSLSQSEDLAQDTFLAAWKHLAELREPEKLRAWLCGIARNLIHSSLRTDGREPSHRAERLDEVPESHSTDPLPVERAISREEAEILWRSLEKIPETYRTPLVLFYREHQSIAAVAQNLELTEEAARQRLSRGRKLLQEEVLAFVEGAIERTSPGKAFTVAMLAALPVAATSAKAAAVGVAAAKGAAGAKGTLSLSAIAGMAPILGAVLFSWKTSVDDSNSPRERKFMVRQACFQVLFFALFLVAFIYWLPKLMHWPWVYAAAFALLILASLVVGAWSMTGMIRRRTAIQMEEGTFPAPKGGVPGEMTNVQSLRRAFKLTIPFLIMFAVGGLELPWKQHWVRASVVVAGESLVVLWFFRKTLRQLRGQIKPWSPRRPAFMRNPLIAVPVILLGSMLLAAAIANLMVFFLNPGMARKGVPMAGIAVALRPIGLGLLLIVLALATVPLLFFVGRRFLAPRWRWLDAKLNSPFLQQMQNLTQGPDALVGKLYATLFQQLNLGADERKTLKDLVLKRTMAGVQAGMSLLNPSLTTAKRATVALEIKSKTDDFNARIKEFLGAANYAVFKQFEKTIPDQTLVDLFASRSAKAAAPLSPEQQARLLQALTEARGHHAWTTELSRRNQGAEDYTTLFDEENLVVFAQEEEQFDRQFLAQAHDILNPEQLAAFAIFQQSQRESKIAQFKTARRLYAPKGGDSSQV